MFYELTKDDFSGLVADIQSKGRSRRRFDNLVSFLLETPEPKVLVRNHRGKFITSDPAENGLLREGGKRPELNCLFAVVVHPDGRISLRDPTGKFVCANTNEGTCLRAEVDWIRAWEFFEPIQIGEDSQASFALRAHNGKYVSAREDGTIRASADAADTWEYFDAFLLPSPNTIELVMSPQKNNPSSASSSLEHLLSEKPVGTLGLNSPERASFLDILDHVLPDRAGEFRQTIEFFESNEKQHIPVAGVCGTLNSGKSTLVSAFLSPRGRDRVLVGCLDTAKASNRFTLWMPESWRDNKPLLAALDGIVESILGRAPELLAEDSGEALAQQNAHGASDISGQIEILLLAFDEGLDSLGFALLDCPDIQGSADTTTSESTCSIRREALEKAARLCSSFVVVASEAQLDTEELGQMLENIEKTAPSLPVALVANKIEGSFPKPGTLETARAIAERWLAKGKFDWIAGAPYVMLDSGTEMPRPEFVRLEDAGPRNLSEYAANLSALNLRDLLVESTRKSLLEAFLVSRKEIADHLHESKDKARELRREFKWFVERKYGDDALGCPGVETRIRESLERYASITDQLVLMPVWIVQSVMDIVVGDRNVYQSESGIDDCSGLANQLDSKYCLGSGVSRRQIRKVAKKAEKIIRTTNATDSELTLRRIDQLVREYWSRASIVDLVWTIFRTPLVLFGGTHPDLERFIRWVVKGLTRQKSADHYAALCDAAGIPCTPRPNGLPKPEIGGQSAAAFLLGTPWIKVKNPALDEIEERL